MFQALIFSDSHGHTEAMKRILHAAGPLDVVFFLGDGVRDFESVAESNPPFMPLCVRGNCDFTSVCFGEPLQKTGIVSLGGKRILYTHGDLFSVKYGSDSLLSYAKEKKADIVLFGHTHRATERYLPKENVYLFNPGSIGECVDGCLHFGRMTWDENQVLYSVGEYTFS